MDKASLASQHINVKELATIIYAIVTWAPFFRGFNFNIYTDNIFSAIAINKGTVRNRTACLLLHDLAAVAQLYDVTVSAHFIPGHENHFADSISRLHSPGQYKRFESLVYSNNYSVTPPIFWWPCHMSLLSAMFLSSQVHIPFVLNSIMK